MSAPKKPKRDLEDMLKQLGDPEEFAKQFPGGKIPRIPPEAMDDLTDAMFDAFFGGDDGNEWASARVSRQWRRGPREKPETIAIREFVKGDLEARFRKMTVRQVYYAVEVEALVPKTQGGYTKVQRLLVKMRRNDDLDWDFIADGTRWVRMRSLWNSVDDFVADVRNSYRANLWRSQGVRIEIWLEKDALAEVSYETTDKWRVPLMVSRGQSSVTFLHNAAQEARQAYERDGTVHVRLRAVRLRRGRRSRRADHRSGPSALRWRAHPL
jgi:hypothetical protein